MFCAPALGVLWKYAVYPLVPNMLVGNLGRVAKLAKRLDLRFSVFALGHDDKSQSNQLEQTKHLMGALVRMKPRSHEKMKVEKKKSAQKAPGRETEAISLGRRFASFSLLTATFVLALFQYGVHATRVHVE